MAEPQFRAIRPISSAPSIAAGGKVKWQVWAIGGLGAAGAIWYTIRKRSSAANAAAADPTGIDPNTGLPFTDSSPAYSTGGTGPTLGGYTDPSTGAYIGSGGTASQTVTTPGSNAEWAQIAIARLSQQGFNPVAIATAIGKYLSNANLTADELGYVQSALAVTGQPPTSVQTPHTAPPTGQTTPAQPTLTAPNLAVQKRTKTGGTLVWSGVTGADYYLLLGNRPPIWCAGNTRTKAVGHGTYHVRAYHGTTAGPPSGNVTV